MPPARSQTWTNGQSVGPKASGVSADGNRAIVVARASHDQLGSWYQTGEGGAGALGACRPPESWHQGESADDAVVPAGPGACRPVPVGQFPASAGFVVAWHWCIGRGTYTRSYLTASRSAAVNRKARPSLFFR